jgi:hypothetical protein
VLGEGLAGLIELLGQLRICTGSAMIVSAVPRKEKVKRERGKGRRKGSEKNDSSRVGDTRRT